MANKFQIKRTTTTGRTPNTTNAANSTYIAAGELAINLTDDKLFSSDGTNLIEIGSNLSSLSVTGNTVVAQINATSLYVGANVNLTTTNIFVGNTTVNVNITSTGATWANATSATTSNQAGLYVGNSTVNAVLTASSLTINSVPISIIGIYDSSNTVLANAFFVSGASINQLSDVDTVTTAPANNNLFVWSNSVSNWVPSSNVDLTTVKIGGKKAINGPVFSAYANNTALQTITSGSQQKVLFQIEEFDTDNCYANSRFTPTVEGYYQLNAEVRIDGNVSSGEAMIALWKNGSTYKRGWNSGSMQTSNTGGWFGMTVSSIVYANGTTDYFEVYVQQTSGSTLNVTGVNDPAITWFNGAMIRGA